jgi:hypothetical protein
MKHSKYLIRSNITVCLYKKNIVYLMDIVNVNKIKEGERSKESNKE